MLNTGPASIFKILYTKCNVLEPSETECFLRYQNNKTKHPFSKFRKWNDICFIWCTVLSVCDKDIKKERCDDLF